MSNADGISTNDEPEQNSRNLILTSRSVFPCGNATGIFSLLACQNVAGFFLGCLGVAWTEEAGGASGLCPEANGTEA